MRTTLLVIAALLGLAHALPAAAQDEALLSLQAAHEACEVARDGEHDHLYSILLDPGWRFGGVDTELGEDGSVVSAFLAVDTRRNLRALRGRVEALPAGLETIGFIASEERALELEAARAAGASIRLGFFLGFDEPARSACLVRGSHGVTTMRVDVAFLELVQPDGTVLAREDTDRFTSWSDDRARDAIPGSGPRAAVGSANVAPGVRAPEAWQRGLEASDVTAALSLCHREGVARGATGVGIARVRMAIDARSGRVSAARVELSNLGDDAENACIAEALTRVALPAGPPELAARVDVGVTIRFAE